MSKQVKDKQARAGVNSLKADYAKQLLLNDDVEGTTQTNTLNPDETPSKVQHIDSNSNIIREDVYTYTDTAITCVRTIVATGQHVTVVENLTSPYNKIVGQVIG